MRDSRNPNDNDELLGAFNTLAKSIRKRMQRALPCVVTAINKNRTVVSVQPLIKMIDSEGNEVSRGVLSDIPIETIGGGNFLISFNISIGDLGWLQTCDRDISLFKQSYIEARPNTSRMHSFSDARFIPDIMTNFNIDDEDSGAIVIQNRDSSVKISLDDTRIKMKAPNIEVEASGTIDFVSEGGCSITDPSGITLNGVTIDAAGAVVSPTSFTAPDVIGSTDVSFGGISGVGHVHDAGNYEDAEARPIVGSSGVAS